MRSRAEPKAIALAWTTSAPHPVDWNASPTSVYLVSQGTDIGQRVGNVITPRKLVWNFTFVNNNTSDNRVVTVCFIRDKRTQNSGTAPSWSDVFEGAVIDATRPNNLVNLLNAGRFDILYRKQFVLSDQNAEGQQRILKGVLRLKPIPIRFNGTGATDIESNPIYMYTCGGSDPTAAEIKMTGQIRMWYTDV